MSESNSTGAAPDRGPNSDGDTDIDGANAGAQSQSDDFDTSGGSALTEEPEPVDGDLSPEEQERMWDETVRGTDSSPDNPTAYFPIEGHDEIEFEIRPIERRKMSSLKRRFPPGLLRAIQQMANDEEPEIARDTNPTEDETDALETTIKRSFHHPKISPHQLQQDMDERWGQMAVNKAAVLAMAVSQESREVQNFRVDGFGA
ncbi:hypothetical protein [Halococcus saccharolyticus]|uniref:Uncharacterized protein n=1 Tax=Halococcus saccharolyticus DSM 5350 TaxID=1227455 RepID=M0MTE2_9EURY|nr:hypothetical protein [Halococcus saccharolyticus]EMA47994.1 hypothetical protein C449_00940 [Halococcus saccharolyticus DSM 5350]